MQYHPNSEDIIRSFLIFYSIYYFLITFYHFNYLFFFSCYRFYLYIYLPYLSFKAATYKSLHFRENFLNQYSYNLYLFRI